MITLDTLKEIGCISTDYVQVDYHGTQVSSYSEVLSWSDKKKSRFDGVVICDNCLWAATLKKLPIVKARMVYTSDGTSLCCWDSIKRTLFIKKLVDNKLVTTAQLIMPKYVKEDNVMAMDLSSLENMDIDGLGVDAQVAPQATVGEGETKESEASRRNRTFIEKINGQGIEIADNLAAVNTNVKLGRSLGFITKTDKSIRMGLVRVLKLNAQGKPILNEEGEKNPEIKQQYERFISNVEGAKKPNSKYLVHEYEFKARQAKPGKIVGMIIAIPAQTASIDYTELIAGAGTVDRTKSENEHVVKILPMEQAYEYLVNAFDGRIKEDESLLGNRAAWLEVRAVVVNDKKAGASVSDESIRYSLKLSKKMDTRKTLLTTGNYIPAALYEALSQNQIKSQEDSDALNYNIAQALSSGDKLQKLTAEAQKVVTDEGTKAKYFSVSASDRVQIEAPEAFDGTGKVADVQIAVRTMSVSKDGKVSYKFKQIKDFSVIAKKPEVKAIIDKTQLTVEEMQAKVTELTKSTSKKQGTPKRIDAIDMETLKKYTRTKSNNTSIKDISRLLAEA